MNYNKINTTCVFSSPIEGDDTLVRTGTPKSSVLASFFTCFIQAINKKFILIDNEKERHEIVNEFHQSIYEKVTKNIDKTKEIHQNIFILLRDCYIHFTLNEIKSDDVNKVIKIIYNNETKKNMYKIITEILPLENFVKILRNTNIKSDKNYSLINYKKVCMREVVNYLDYQQIFDSIDKKKLIIYTIVLLA